MRKIRSAAYVFGSNRLKLQEVVLSKNLLFIEKTPLAALRKAKERGLNVILLASNQYDYTKIRQEELKYVDTFIEADYKDMESTLRKSIEFNDHSVPIDGVLTFFEYAVPITSCVAAKLNLAGIPVENAENSRNKYLMRTAFEKHGVPIPSYKSIQTLYEAMAFASVIGYPNVIKPVNMAASRYVFKNYNSNDLEKHFALIDGGNPPYGEAKQRTILLEEYMDGQEFSVESVISRGKIHHFAITQKTTTGVNTFVEIGHVVPASLTVEIESEIYKVASQGISALGLNSCVTHSEIKLTSKGPKIVEIAGRLGGDRIPELVKLASGIDLWDMALSAALNEELTTAPKRNQSAAIAFLTAEPGKIEHIEGIETAKKNDNIHDVTIKVRKGDIVSPLSNSFDRIGEVIATGTNPGEAQRNALKASKIVKFSIDKHKHA